MKAIKLQRSNKLHHYWLSQYIKAIVLHQREFEFEFWPIRKFHFIQPGPVPSTILNYCPIKMTCFSIHHLEFLSNHRLSCHLELLSNQKTAFHLPSCIFDQSEMSCPPHPTPWHRTVTSTLLVTLCMILPKIDEKSHEIFDPMRRVAEPNPRSGNVVSIDTQDDWEKSYHTQRRIFFLLEFWILERVSSAPWVKNRKYVCESENTAQVL